MKKKINKMLRIGLHSWLIVAVVFAMSGLYLVHDAEAAALTSKSDTMSRLQDNTASNHTIGFTQDAGTQFIATETITVTFGSTGSYDFDLTSLANTDASDYDITVNATEELIVAAGACAAQDAIEITSIGASPDVITFTACGSYTAEAAGSAIVIEIGTNATSPGAGDTQITNPDVGSDTTYEIAIAGDFGDTGAMAVEIILDDTVNITAAVDEALNFAISDTTIGFGTLTSANARYATSDTNGDTTPQIAHTLIAGTNATGGYTITVQGATLTSGANTITAIAAEAVSSPASEQFGIRMTEAGGSGVVDTDYDDTAANTYFYGGTAGASDDVAAAAGSSADTTYSCYYLGNIASDTEAGAYETDLTYIATATY